MKSSADITVSPGPQAPVCLSMNFDVERVASRNRLEIVPLDKSVQQRSVVHRDTAHGSLVTRPWLRPRSQHGCEGLESFFIVNKHIEEFQLLVH